jgi:hypothetical protein
MKFFAFITVLLLFSCTPEKKQAKVDQDIKPRDIDSDFVINEVASDSIYLIKFGNGIQVNWNRNTHRIMRDSLLKSQLPYFKKNTEEIINQITNRTELPLFVCGTKNKLVIGDIAYIILQRLYDLYFVTGDVFAYQCPYPAGFFEAIDRDREGLQEKIRKEVKKAKIHRHFPESGWF